MFFYLGYNITIFAGNLETLFIGWEVLGICSFLLIAFYRERFLPVRNALKVYTVYRVGDVGLIMAMWMGHHLWHQNITFYDLSHDQLVHAELETHSLIGVFISLMLLITAAAKSAQLPFSSWLPRAMEESHPIQRHFLRFSFCAFWRVPSLKNLRIMGESNLCSDHYWAARIEHKHYRYSDCQGAIFGEKPDCVFIHRANRFDLYRSGVGSR